MSEYWKSTPKYWCKHCSTYVKDTPFEKKQHEATGKHQGNLKRFLRTIQNDHERGEREKQQAKAEVERLNRITGSGPSSTASLTAASTIRKPTSSSLTAVDQKRQWAQLAEMGIAVPDQYRTEVAMAGDWKVVSQQPVVEPGQEESLSMGVRKRKFEGQEEEQEAGETVVRKGWGSTTKRYPGKDQADLDDLFSGNIALNKKVSKSEEPTVKFEQMKGSSDASAPCLQTKSESLSRDEGSISVSVKIEDDKEKTVNTMNEPEPLAAPIFKKRKAKANNS